MVQRALDAGIHLFDTADIYDYGAAELALARALQHSPRADILLASKVFFPMSDAPRDRGLSREHIFRSIDQSLIRLNTDYLDLYQCHRFDPETPLEETVQAMGDLIKLGKIRHWGTSTFSASQLQRAHDMARSLGVAPPTTEQARYNFLCREVEAEVVPMADALKMGLLWWSPLAQGLLTGKYQNLEALPADSRAADPQRVGDFLDRALANQEVMLAAHRFHDVARSLGVPTASLALAWCLHQQPGSCVLIGARTPAQLDEALQATTISWTPDIRAAFAEWNSGQDFDL